VSNDCLCSIRKKAQYKKKQKEESYASIWIVLYKATIVSADDGNGKEEAAQTFHFDTNKI
jgi:hypothetical protein